MKVLLVIGILLAALLLISLIRIGAAVNYADGALVVRMRIGFLWVNVFPRKKKKKQKTVKKKRKKPRPEGEKKKSKGKVSSVELLREFLPVVAEAAGDIKRKIRIDRLDLELTVAAADPAATALAFGAGNALVGMFIPLLENNFHVRERNSRIYADYDRDQPDVTLRAALSLTIGQALSFGVRYGLKTLGILQKRRKETEKQADSGENNHVGQDSYGEAS